MSGPTALQTLPEYSPSAFHVLGSTMVSALYDRGNSVHNSQAKDPK